MERKEKMDEILRKDGLSLKLLDMLSLKSSLTTSLKKDLKYFNKEELLNDIFYICEQYDSIAFIQEIATDCRVKSFQSTKLKYERYYPDHQARKVFDDLLGFRVLCNDYDEVLKFDKIEHIRIADLSNGKIPELLQWDERWGYAPYGTGIVATSGCGPTCMAMVAAGLNQDASITPAKVAAYGTEHGYVDEENNTYWRFMDEAGANWNLNSVGGMLSEEQVSAELAQGHPVICSMGPGDFTQIGHFIVLTGYENGTVTVNDPFSIKNTNTAWTFANIKDQIKAMWTFSKK